MPIIDNPVLYEEAKRRADSIYEKPSAYKSGYIVKLYKDMGGTYTDDNKPRNLGRWFREEWSDVADGDYPVYRPTVRVSKKTPLLASEIDPENLKKQIALKQKIKGKANLPPFKMEGGASFRQIGEAALLLNRSLVQYNRRYPQFDNREAVDLLNMIVHSGDITRRRGTFDTIRDRGFRYSQDAQNIIDAIVAAGDKKPAMNQYRALNPNTIQTYGKLSALRKRLPDGPDRDAVLDTYHHIQNNWVVITPEEIADLAEAAVRVINEITAEQSAERRTQERERNEMGAEDINRATPEGGKRKSKKKKSKNISLTYLEFIK